MLYIINKVLHFYILMLYLYIADIVNIYDWHYMFN